MIKTAHIWDDFTEYSQNVHFMFIECSIESAYNRIKKSK